MEHTNIEVTTVDILGNEPKTLFGAIVFLDIANYSGMMQSNADQALVMLRAFKEIINPAVKRLQGIKVKDTGDGCLLFFSSGQAALSASLQIQKDLIKKSIPVRIGIHADTVTLEDGDIYGDGVNVASRIEGYAAVGGVYFSQNIHETVKQNKAFDIEEIGSVQLKNMKDPFALYALANEGLSYEKGKKPTFSERLHWIPNESLAQHMGKAKKGAALFGAAAFLFGCRTMETGPVTEPGDECGDACDHINSAFNASGKLSTAVNEDMSFNDAFAAARDDVGAGGFFEWHGQVYNTYEESEFESLADHEVEAIIDQIDEVVATHEAETEEIYDVSDALQMETVTYNGVDALVFSDNGQVVKIELDSDGNGTFDLTIADTTGDGQLDTSGLMTVSGELIQTQELEVPMDHDTLMQTASAEGSLSLEDLYGNPIDSETDPEFEVIDEDPSLVTDEDVIDINPIDTFEDEQEIGSEEYDIDINPEVIAEAVDLDGNGTPDAYIIDEDFDGVVDGVAYDANENGITEMIEVDNDGDGYVDAVILDENEDGIIDEPSSPIEVVDDYVETPPTDIYENDIPGMTNAEDMTAWQSDDEIASTMDDSDFLDVG